MTFSVAGLQLYILSHSKRPIRCRSQSPDKERRCSWGISVELGRRIRLEFTDFDLKSSDGCFDHYVQASFQFGFLIG